MAYKLQKWVYMGTYRFDIQKVKCLYVIYKTLWKFTKTIRGFTKLTKMDCLIEQVDCRKQGFQKGRNVLLAASIAVCVVTIYSISPSNFSPNERL